MFLSLDLQLIKILQVALMSPSHSKVALDAHWLIFFKVYFKQLLPEMLMLHLFREQRFKVNKTVLDVLDQNDNRYIYMQLKKKVA